MEQTQVSYKTLNKLTVLPVVSSALKTASTVYENVKSTNVITRTTFGVAETSFQLFTHLVAVPLANVAKNPSL